MDLCLSVFPWALFRSTKSGVKLHALLDLRGSIPAFVHVSHARLGDVNVLEPASAGARRVPRHGPGLSRLPTVEHAAFRRFLLRDPRQVEHQIPPQILPGSRQVRGRAVRPDRRPHGGKGEGRLSAAAAPRQIPRCRDGQDVRLPDQQLRRPGRDGGRSLSLPVARRTVFQMDKATPSHQVVLRKRRRTR